MRRAGGVCFLIGVVALAVALWLPHGAATMQSYLPAWLFFLAVPLGALPLLMALELAGGGRSPLARALRRVLLPLPIAALLVIPVLLDAPALYPWRGHPPPGFAGAWLHPGLFTLRSIVFLAIWALLGLVFIRPPAPGGSVWRRAAAGLGLLLHLVMGTMAAVDWAMSLELALNSSAFGLLLIVSQCGVALAAALLLAAVLGDDAAVAAGARPMLVLLGFWMFLQFTQYLVVWSANLPGEIVWYQQRNHGLGLAAAWFALASLLLSLLTLTPRLLNRRTKIVASVAGMVLLLHLVEALWLVTPAFRGRFVVTGPDLLLLAGVGGLVIGVAVAAASFARPGGSLARA